MQRLIVRSILAALAVATTSVVIAAPPPAVEKAICRPEFQIEKETVSAGTAFVLDLQGAHVRSFLVSAHHLFGPDGGYATQIPWSEVSAKVKSMQCTSLSDGAVWTVGHALTMSGAERFGDGYLRDLSAFAFEDVSATSRPTHLKLAARMPKVGQSVWLLAEVVEGAPRSLLLHHAVVTYSQADAMQYNFDNAKLSIRATSGAPVLDDAGDVVGVNLAGGLHGGVMSGTSDSVISIRALLESAK